MMTFRELDIGIHLWKEVDGVRASLVRLHIKFPYGLRYGFGVFFPPGLIYKWWF